MAFKKPTAIDGWLLEEQLGAGKSATVFAASKEGSRRAVKIFDPELVDKYGRDVQLGRIKRELSLVGSQHAHLVQIFDGGECSTTGLLYVVMELLDAPNLATVLPDVPREQVWPILSQIASAARFLEGRQLVHRDIKPDNIAVSRDFQRATLLDLGVIRPFGVADLTDAEQRFFIGTLRYSSPEFLLREEEDTIDGWRALTFYQLGAVLHDMIMKKRLFGDITEPYARLVQAVEQDIPKVEAADLPADLVFLSRNCLLKDPQLRLRFVDWALFDVPPPKTPRVADLKDRIRRRQAAAGTGVQSHKEDVERVRAVKQRTAEVQAVVQNMIRQECVGTDYFPPVMIAGTPTEKPDAVCSAVYFPASSEHGTSAALHIWVLLTLLDEASCAVQLEVWALASNQQEPAKVVDGPKRKQLFTGVFDEAVIRPRIQELLYGALDETQQLHARSGNPGSDDDYWLTLSDSGEVTKAC